MNRIVAKMTVGLRSGILAGCFCAALFAITVTVVFALTAGTVRAKPDFAKSTKRACSACHTRGYPLTPFGEAFKANNYKLPGERRTCRRATIKLYDSRGVHNGTYRGCFPVGGPTVTIGQ